MLSLMRLALSLGSYAPGSSGVPAGDNVITGVDNVINGADNVTT